MVKAVPVNSKGEVEGPVKNFSDQHWIKMKNHFGKDLAWKQISKDTEAPKKEIKQTNIKEVELIAKVSTKKAKHKNEK